MNEEKIKELFELCLRVSNETTAHVNFEYTAKVSVQNGRYYENAVLPLHSSPDWNVHWKTR